MPEPVTKTDPCPALPSLIHRGKVLEEIIRIAYGPISVPTAETLRGLVEFIIAMPEEAP